MLYTIKHFWLCFREKIIICFSLSLFLLAAIYLLSSLETIIELYPYHVLGCISLAVFAFCALNYKIKQY